MTKKQKKILIRIIITIILTAALLLIPLTGIALNGIPRLIAYLAVYAVIGYDIVIKAAKGIINGRVFDENFLMTIATLGAFFLGIWTGSGDYLEAIAVMLFYQIGELFESYAVGKSRRNISELMDIRPDYANIEAADTPDPTRPVQSPGIQDAAASTQPAVDTARSAAALIQVDPSEVAIGTIIVVQPGEKVPIDGIVESGTSAIDTAALTGESLPRTISAGEEVYSGTINIDHVLRVRTTKEFGESTASKILDLVENASSNKSRTENFISRFAAVYTPVVCGAALFIAVIIPLIRLISGMDGDWETWVYRGLTFLVVSCPCAFVVSIPLSFFAGLGCASSEGVLVKGSNYLETLSRVTTVVFDKTGTLTYGNFAVEDVHSKGIIVQDTEINAEKLLELATLSECASSHPISKSLQQAYGKKIDRNRVEDIRETGGHGIAATVDGIQAAVGNDKLMDRLGIVYDQCDSTGTIVHVALDGVYAGYIVIADAVKPTSAEAIKELRKTGVSKTVMLTGDRAAVADKVGAELGIDEVYSELLPADKVIKVEMLINDMQGGCDSSRSNTGSKAETAGAGGSTAAAADKNAGRSRLAFAGDGINDAPVLARADVGIAMGALGSDAAIEAADVVLMHDDPMQIVKAMKISRKCIRIVYENIIFALVIKLGCLVLTTCGVTDMWAAIFADVGVMVLCVLNAIRALRYRA